MKLIFSGPGNVPGAVLQNPTADTCYCVKGFNDCGTTSATDCVIVESCPASCGGPILPTCVGISEGKKFNDDVIEWNCNGFFTYMIGDCTDGIFCEEFDPVANPSLHYNCWNGHLNAGVTPCSYGTPVFTIDLNLPQVDGYVVLGGIGVPTTIDPDLRVWVLQILVYECSGTPPTWTSSTILLWEGTKCGSSPLGVYTKRAGEAGGCSTDPKTITISDCS